MQLTAGSVRQNYNESVKRLLSNENIFHLMSSAKGTQAYCQQFFHEVLAMVKQLGIPTTSYIRITSYIINKLNNLNLSAEEIRNLTYQQQTKLLNDDPVLVARHFKYKVQVFSKEIALD